MSPKRDCILKGLNGTAGFDIRCDCCFAPLRSLLWFALPTHLCLLGSLWFASLCIAFDFAVALLCFALLCFALDACFFASPCLFYFAFPVCLLALLRLLLTRYQGVRGFACLHTSDRQISSTDSIDHPQMDHLVPQLPLSEVVQDLRSTYPTQETRAVSCSLYGSHPATWARSYRSYRSCRSSALKGLL